MFARFDINPARSLQHIKKKNVTDGRTHGRENSIPTTNKVCGGFNKINITGTRLLRFYLLYDIKIILKLQLQCENVKILPLCKHCYYWL